jgi:hypothetical protein
MRMAKPSLRANSTALDGEQACASGAVRCAPAADRDSIQVAHDEEFVVPRPRVQARLTAHELEHEALARAVVALLFAPGRRDVRAKHLRARRVGCHTIPEETARASALDVARGRRYLSRRVLHEQHGGSVAVPHDLEEPRQARPVSFHAVEQTPPPHQSDRQPQTSAASRARLAAPARTSTSGPSSRGGIGAVLPPGSARVRGRRQRWHSRARPAGHVPAHTVCSWSCRRNAESGAQLTGRNAELLDNSMSRAAPGDCLPRRGDAAGSGAGPGQTHPMARAAPGVIRG